MLDFKGVAKQYLYGARLFGALDLTLSDGEILSVLGGEKSGKTSLVKIAAGIEDYEGSILLDGKKVTTKTDDVIVLFDDGAVFKYKTVFDNLAYPLSIRKVDKAEIAKRVIEVADKLGIGACLNMRAKNLSALEKRKMSVCRLFLRDARLLLIDDLTKGLNYKEARELFDAVSVLLAACRKSGTSVIFATSEPEEAIKLGGRILVLSDGQIKQIGTAEELWNTPASAWSAEAIDKDYNIVKCTLSCQNDEINLVFNYKNDAYAIDASALRERVLPAYYGKEVLVGFHPEDVTDGVIIEHVTAHSGFVGGYILSTESGVKIRSKLPADEVSYSPNIGKVTLYDATTESSIMRNK